MKPHRLFFYLLILFLPSQLGLHMWPSWSMVLGRRIDYLSPTLYFTDILIILLLASWFGEFILRGWGFVLGIMEKKRKEVLQFTLIHNTKTIILLLLFVLLNIYFSLSRPVAIYYWIKFFELFLFGIYIVKTKFRLFHTAIFLSVAVLYSSVLAIWQFILQHSVGGLWWFLGERTFTNATAGIAQIPLCFARVGSCPLLLRSYGTFSHPNVLGGFLALTLPFLLFEYPNILTERSKIMYWIQKVFLLSILLGVVALILTFSRSAWVVGAVLMTWTFVEQKKQEAKSKKHVRTVSAIIGITALVILVALSLRSTDESVVVREQLNTSAIHMWQMAPIFGVGLGNFLVALPHFLPLRTVYFLQPAHNIYLLLLSEIGVIGICLVLFFIIKLLKSESRIKTPSPIHYSLIALLLLGLVDHYPLTLQQGQLLLTIFMSLSLVPSRHVKS